MQSAFRFDTEWGEGWLEVDARGDGDCAVVAMHPPGSRVPARAQVAKRGAPARVRQLVRDIAGYLAGHGDVELATREEIDAWLAAAGVDGFRHAALSTLIAVPFGTTISYGMLAELAGRPRAARAAGTACATNPLPLVVPCHRVLPASGRLRNSRTLRPRYNAPLLRLEHVRVKP
jgi:O-6-methylguanine DNA methyltransferase